MYVLYTMHKTNIKNGKDFFLEFSINNSVSIHKFIYNHYFSEMDDNPSSRAIFEKN